MKTEKLILSIDLGTSGPKVGIVTSSGNVLACEIGEVRLKLGENGAAEQDPRDWKNSITSTSRALLKKNPKLKSKIEAIAVTTHWSGTVCIDSEGKVLADCIMWLDTRGSKYIKKAVSGVIKFQGYGLFKLLEWLRLTGGVPTHSGKDSIAHLLYIKHERHELYQKTFKFLEPKDYINFWLTGQIAASYDSIGLHWLTDTRNYKTQDYSSKLLKWTGIEREKLPDLISATQILGTSLPNVSKELGLLRPVPVVCGSPDIHSASVGSGAVKDFEGHLYVGTSSWIVAHVPFKKTDIFHNMASLPSPIPGRYFIANEQETTGECLRFLANHILFPRDILNTKKPNDVYGKLNALAETSPPGSNGLLFTPWLAGERTPVEDPYVRGGFFNLGLHNNRADMIRSIMEGVAFNLKWLFLYVEKFSGKKMQHLNVIGGGARSDLWCQILADVIERPMRRVKDPVEANVRGAGLIASVGMGWNSFENISENIQIDTIFEPIEKNRRVYDKLFKEFLQIYDRNKSIFRRLNQ